MPRWCSLPAGRVDSPSSGASDWRGSCTESSTSCSSTLGERQGKDHADLPSQMELMIKAMHGLQLRKEIMIQAMSGLQVMKDIMIQAMAKSGIHHHSAITMEVSPQSLALPPREE